MLNYNVPDRSINIFVYFLDRYYKKTTQICAFYAEKYIQVFDRYEMLFIRSSNHYMIACHSFVNYNCGT